MDGDALKKVQAGDALEIPARFYNAAIDVIRAQKQSAFDTGGVPLKAQQALMCVAEDALTIPFSLVRIPRTASSLNYANRNEWHPYCRIPDLPWTSEVGIAQRGCAAGEMVPVVVGGLSVCTCPTRDVEANVIGPGALLGTQIGSPLPVAARADYTMFGPGPIKVLAYLTGAFSMGGYDNLRRLLVNVTGDRGDWYAYTPAAGAVGGYHSFQVIAVGDGWLCGQTHAFGPVVLRKV